MVSLEEAECRARRARRLAEVDGDEEGEVGAEAVVGGVWLL